jgi:GNAT superfamily N-acetyltransferase
MTRTDPKFGEGEIVGLHVLPSEWGQRIGSALHDAALAMLSGEGHRTAGLWVIAANQRARRMYERRGWLGTAPRNRRRRLRRHRGAIPPRTPVGASSR